MSQAPPKADSLLTASGKLLSVLAGRSWAADFYLAGSAGLSCYRQHRQVRDLDLMSGVNRLRGAERRDLLQDLLTVDAAARVETARDGFLYMRFPRAVGLRFFYYPYPMIDREEEVMGMALASLLDLALMKLGAIISRGGRRDFVDAFLICQGLPLEEILERSAEKFGHVGDFQLQALKGLADLSLARGEPMPTLRREVNWPEVEAWIGTEVRRLARRRVGLSQGPGSIRGEGNSH